MEDSQLLKKEPKSGGFYILVAMALAMFVATTVLFFTLFHTSEIQFDSVVWKDDDKSTRDGSRLRMADYLVTSRALMGKTRGEVLEMLGKPPETGYFKDWDFVYLLGPERGFLSIDSEWLVVRMRPDGRVVEYQIVRD